MFGMFVVFCRLDMFGTLDTEVEPLCTACSGACAVHTSAGFGSVACLESCGLQAAAGFGSVVHSEPCVAQATAGFDSVVHSVPCAMYASVSLDPVVLSEARPVDECTIELVVRGSARMRDGTSGLGATSAIRRSISRELLCLARASTLPFLVIFNLLV